MADQRSSHPQAGVSVREPEADAFPPGVAEWLGWAASRGLHMPRDFVWWLINAPRLLSFEQCVALHLVAKGWS